MLDRAIVATVGVALLAIGVGIIGPALHKRLDSATDQKERRRLDRLALTVGTAVLVVAAAMVTFAMIVPSPRVEKISEPGTTTPPPATQSPSSSPSVTPSTTAPSATVSARPAPPSPPRQSNAPRADFKITAPATVPWCSDITGVGYPPTGPGVVVLYIQRERDEWFYFERPVEFNTAAGTWVSPRVVIGDLGAGGADFRIYAVVVTPEKYAKLEADCQGVECKEKPLPGPELAWADVERTAQRGVC